MSEMSPEIPQNSPPNSSPEEIEVLKKESLEEVIEQSEKIAPILVEIANRIIKEKPDKVIFLDKSARIFATPLRKFIRDKQTQQGVKAEKQAMPDFSFINLDRDEFIKQDEDPETGEECTVIGGGKEYLESKEAELKPLLGKNIFVIDETFAMGINATIWEEIRDFLGETDPATNIHFFALSNDTSKDDHSNLREHKKKLLKTLSEKENFEITVGEYEAPHLFPTDVIYQYIKDEVDKDQKPIIAGINIVLDKWEDDSDEEKAECPKDQLEKVVKIIHEMSQRAKDIVYEKMTEEDNK